MFNFFLRLITPQRPLGPCPFLLWGEASSLFDPQEVFPHLCRQGSLPGPQEWAPYLYSSRAQLLPLALSLECLGENKGRLTPLDKYQLSSPGPIHLLPQLKQQKYIISQFWRLEVQQQVVKRSGFFWGLSSSLWLLVFCVFPWTSYVWASVS